MNHTTNYQLNQWAKSDKVQMDDFNADNAKIDGALKAASDARAALQTALNKKGNCTVGLITYTGDGRFGIENPTLITFPRRPTFFVATGDGGIFFGWGSRNVMSFVCRGTVSGISMGTSQDVTWSGSTLSFHSHNNAYQQLNTAGQSYIVTAFYIES